MNADSNLLLQALAWYSDTFLGSAPAAFAVLGLVLWALGGGTMGLHLRIRSAGYLIVGTVLGTVNRRRVTTSLGGTPAEDVARHLAVEYRDARGHTRQGLLSEWEESYAQLAQDQALILWVAPNRAYDDLYIAKRRGAPKLAVTFVVTGSLCLFHFWPAPWLWLIGMLILFFAGALSFRFLSRLPEPEHVPADKQFEPGEIEPMVGGRTG